MLDYVKDWLVFTRVKCQGCSPMGFEGNHSCPHVEIKRVNVHHEKTDRQTKTSIIIMREERKKKTGTCAKGSNKQDSRYHCTKPRLFPFKFAKRGAPTRAQNGCTAFFLLTSRLVGAMSLSSA